MEIVTTLLKGLFGSKKFVALVIGLGVTAAVKMGLPEDAGKELSTQVVALVATYLGAQGIADAGKEKAKIEVAAKEKPAA